MSTQEILDSHKTKYTFENGSYCITSLEIEEERSYVEFTLYRTDGTMVHLTQGQFHSLRSRFHNEPDLKKVEEFLK